ncbi:MAG TPA: hypothetical protein VFW44_14705 [Bryobacteraceae bacterium]|nr:hypothetical protein [Bryobacteraceae bacterium]
MKFFTAFLLSVAYVVPVAAQWVHYPTPGLPRAADGKPNLAAPAPRTASGQPDFTGLWEMSGDLAVGNISARNVGDLKPSDIQPWAEALVRQRTENFGRDNPRYHCLPEGPGYAAGGGGLKRFIQTPAMIVILNEDLTYRQIFMDGRKLEDNPNPTWMGYAVGHWDGDALVVESDGYNDHTWLLDGYPHTEKLHMTERYRRPDFGHLQISVTYNDPGAYNKSFTVPVNARLAADTELLETVCAENVDNGQEHWIGKVSDGAKAAAKIAPEVLAKYVGLYKGPYLLGPRTEQVTFSDGTLFVSINGGAPQPIYPTSETSFTGTGLTYRFVRNQQGVATNLIESHISGDYTYARQ